MKIKLIQNVGCLKDLHDEINMKSTAFLYGLNGAGKSTIKSMFINAFDEKGKLSVKYGKTARNCNAKIQIFNKDVEFKASKVVEPIKSNIKLHVYDNNYVEKSIYVNGSINDDNQSEYLRIFIGEDIENKINKKLEECHELNNLISECKEIAANFNKTCEFVVEFENVIKSIKEFCSTKIDIRYAIELSLKRKINKNTIGSYDKTIRWLLEGKNIQKSNDVCPYCGQTISSDLYNNLIDHYESIVNDSLSEIENKSHDIDSFIEKVNKIDNLQLYFSDFDIQSLKTTLIDSLNKKRNNMSDSLLINVDKDLNLLLKGFKYFKKFSTDFSSLLDTLLIDNIMKAPNYNDDYKKKIVNGVNNIISRFNNNLVDKLLIDDLTNKMNQIGKLNLRISSGMDNILTEQNSKVTNNLKFLNRKLEEYTFKYKICIESIEQKNLKKKSLSMLMLKLVPIECETVNKDFEKDKIKNVLSEGEKSILSWIFFLLDIKDSLKSGRHLLIIDDPISSYDSYRRFNLVNELQELMKVNTSIEVLLLSHEKSFTNVVYNQKVKFNCFNVNDGNILPINIDDIVESNIKDDLNYMKKTHEINDLKELLIFIIRSRNIIEFYQIFLDAYLPKSNSLFKQRLNNNFAIASETIHMEKNSIPNSYFKFICKLVKKITTYNMKLEVNVPLKALNFSDLLNSIDNPYLARVKINNELLDLLTKHNVDFDKEAVTGELLKIANKFNILKEDYYNICHSFMPILNVYNHPNDNYGLRRVDCSEIKLKRLYDYLNNEHIIEKN